jgi:NADPH:quinone reductase-like Zn-dependent oxidoreductase
MKAIVYYRYGPPEVLQLQEIEKPAPADIQVLIKVRAASVNPYDWHFMRGTPGFARLFIGLGKPKSNRLGADVSGVVEAVGSSITRLKPGDAVFGTAKGAFAEYACGKESELALKPAEVTFEQAASVAIAGLTALQGLRDGGKVEPGQTVLINGAAGGVGTFAVQIARNLGASVTAVCSTANLAMVQSIGATDAIDYTREDFTTAGRQYDVIFDLVGNHPLAALRRALKPTGTLVACGGGGPEKTSMDLLLPMFEKLWASRFTSQRLVGVLAKINASDLDLLAEMLQSGKVTPVLDKNYALAEVPDAIRYVEACHARGKVTVSVP